MIKKREKFFDILPPATDKVRPLGRPEPLAALRKGWSGKKMVVTAVCVLMAAGGSYLFFALPRAEITIWPETEILEVSESIEVNAALAEPDFSAGAIPGKILENEKGAQQEFPSSGEALQALKAEGTIRVYNTYSNSPQTFVANTRFMADSGKVFRAFERIVVPGKKLEQGKWIPGQADILVQAAEPGPDYNIGPSTFSIPGLAGTPLYTAFYGKSFSPMTGGFVGKIPEVTKSDIDLAKDSLVGRLREEGKTALEAELDQDSYLLEEALSQETIEAKAYCQAGESLELFTYEAKIKSEALVFEKSKVESFARNFIGLQVPEDKRIYEESLKINWIPKEIDLKSGKMTLDLEISAIIYHDFNLDSFKKEIEGTSLEGTKVFLENQPEVARATIKFWPFWVRKVPKDSEKVKIELRIGWGLTNTKDFVILYFVNPFC